MAFGLPLLAVVPCGLYFFRFVCHERCVPFTDELSILLIFSVHGSFVCFSDAFFVTVVQAAVLQVFERIECR